MQVLIIDDIHALRVHAASIVRQTVPGDLTILQASTGKEGLLLAQTHRPDLIICDICMPDMNGIKVARLIWRQEPKQKILFWSQFHREVYVRELGRILPDDAIHGYVLKSESDQKLAYAIESVLINDNPYIDPSMRNVQARLQSRDSSLSDVEYETLIDITQGLTDRAIARRRNISVRGVQNRMAMLMNKLTRGTEDHVKESAGMEVFNPRTRAIFYGLQRGLIDPDDFAAFDSDIMQWVADEFSCDFTPCQDEANPSIASTATGFQEPLSQLR